MKKPNMQRLTRRSVLKSIGALAALPSGLMTAQAAIDGGRKPRMSKTPYGVAVELKPFRDDAKYRDALIRYTDILVPMNALKWASLRPGQNKFDFSGADEIIEFARLHGKSIRGHNLLWQYYNPKWVDAIDSKQLAQRLLVEHIEKVVDRYKGVISSWDVVNEVVAHDPLTQGRWRKGIWSKMLGPQQVEIAFRTAAHADPAAQLVINDYDLENYGPRFDARRKAVLEIVRNLQSQNIPVHGVGLQAHLYAEREIDQDGLGKFISTLKQMGIATLITELDVIDWKLPKNLVSRDIAVANVAAEFLKAVYAQGAVDSIVSWGISDRYSWISDTFKRKDGAPNRPLPLDRNYQPKPFFDVIEKFRGGG